MIPHVIPGSAYTHTCYIKRRRYRCRDSYPWRTDTLKYFLYIFHNKSNSSHVYFQNLLYVFLLCHSPKRHLPISNYFHLLLVVAAVFWVRFTIHWLFFLALKKDKDTTEFVNRNSSVVRPSVCGIDYLWGYCTDFFQILVVDSSGPYAQTLFFWKPFFFTNILLFR